MARSNYYTQPYRKELEVYTEFSGGMNSFAPNGDLKDNEMALIKNKDLGNRGSLLRRHGMTKVLNSFEQGKGQGSFRYYNTDGTFTDILAVNGKFEIDGAFQTVIGLSSFQTIKPIEAVQVYEKMYIATGTKLVVYDGTKFEVATPYSPSPLEGLYYGFNALSPDPTNYMTDGISAGISASGITFDKRYIAINDSVKLTGYVLKPDGIPLQYQFEYRTSDMEIDTWLIGQIWGVSKEWVFTPNKATDYQFKFSVRMLGDLDAESFYLIPKYTVKTSLDAADLEPNVSNIQGCNRILVHVDRVFLYGDSNNKDMVYISHIDNPLYYPVPNCIRFNNPQNEELTTVIQYRDKLVAMTDTSIQALLGSSPADYQKVMLNTTVGCIAPYSAVVVENFIYFLSQDGVYRLKQVGTTEDRANVDKLDTSISNVMYHDMDACAVFYDLQYHLVFPTRNKRFRYYNELGAWVMDESPKLDCNNLYVRNAELYCQSKVNGNVFKFDKTVYNDDGYVYQEEIQTKAYSFGQPYHPKTMRELLISISPKLGEFKAKLSVYIDNIPILKSSGGEALVGEDGYVTWNPYDRDNLNVKNGTIMGEWSLGDYPLGEVDKIMVKQSLSGKGLEIKVNMKQDVDTPNEIFGFSFIFKVKKPK